MSGKIKNKSCKRPAPARFIKARAKELLFAGENHLNIILALIATATTAVAPLVVCSMVYDYVDEAVYGLALIALEFFLVSPMFFGLFRMVRRMSKGERVTFAEVFFGFSSFRIYIKNLVTAFAFALMIALAISLIVYGTYTLTMGFKGEARIIETFLTVPLCILLAALVLDLITALSLMPLLVAMDVNIFRALVISVRATIGNVNRIVRFAISFLPLIAISVVAVCVPLLVYTIPYLLCVYVMEAMSLIENKELTYIER